MREKYIEQLRFVLRSYFEKLDIHKTAKAEDKAYLDGYIDAGRAIGLDVKAIQEIIDAVHTDLYGMSVNQRRKERALNGNNPKAWSVFDTPAWKRLRKT